MDDSSKSKTPARYGPKRRRWVLGLVAAVALIVCATTVALLLFLPVSNPLNLEYRRGYQEGVYRAERDLEKDCARKCLIGLPNWNELLDRETGLPYLTLGCIVDPHVEGFRDGYDGRIREYIRQHGLPPNSRKRWENALFHLQRYWALHEGNSSVATIKVNGPPVRSPDGKRSIRFARMPYDVRFGGQYLLLAITPAEGPEIRDNAWPIPRDSEAIQCCWGPAGSDVAVLLWETAGKQEGRWLVWEARDLRTGRQLRRESRPKEQAASASARSKRP